MRPAAGEGGTIRVGQNQFDSATYLAGMASQTVGPLGATTCYVDNDGRWELFCRPALQANHSAHG
jgi:hypothetical protein